MDLQVLFFEVIRTFDCAILEGYRNEADQEAAFERGATKLHYPHGKHNGNPSMAVDAAPYPIDFKDAKRFYYFGGYVMGIAERLKNEGKMTYSVRWGGDWDKDTEINDQTFFDLVHFELI
jgi:peptidoglycan L-alanyl-D-glutamate endopeptidase CwlK